MIDNVEGGPAFPTPVNPNPYSPASQPGMTLRDHFAGEAMNAMMVALLAKSDDGAEIGEAIPKICALAWKTADWMIEKGRPQ